MGGGRVVQTAPHSLSGCHPSFRGCCGISPGQGCGNHARARACADTATPHAWARTHRRIYTHVLPRTSAAGKLPETRGEPLFGGIQLERLQDTCKPFAVNLVLFAVIVGAMRELLVIKSICCGVGYVEGVENKCHGIFLFLAILVPYFLQGLIIPLVPLYFFH